ncbi:MAG: protein kinase [Cyanobacteria bacterium J06638_22]
MSHTQNQRTLAAIVLTDAVGFSARMSVDEERTLQLIQRDLHLIETLCREKEGKVLKSTGDGLLLYFTSAMQAVSCAIEVQNRLAEVNADLSPKSVLFHRIGIHLGDVFFSKSDVMGNGVNIAARLQTEAEPGGICISNVVHDVVKSQMPLNATFVGALKLKNIQQEVPAYHIQTAGSLVASEPPQKPEPAQEQPERVKRKPEPAHDQSESLKKGDRVGGRYIIQRILGQGGFGRSYLASDQQRFGELCVLKEFRPANRSSRAMQKGLDLFKREAKTLYQIEHPQIPKFLACFTQAQRLFIVQEFIDGITYSQLLRQQQTQSFQGPLFAEADIVHWLRQMLQVLDYLHNLNIIHRDISPDNIILSRDRNLPVLIDFGLVNDALARIMSEDEEEGDRQPSSIVGKFGYSPPEQLRLGMCYPSSDLYALGVTALVLLSGRFPKDLMNTDTLDWEWEQHIDASAGLVRLLRQLLLTSPKERYQSAQDVLTALDALPPVEPSNSLMSDTTTVAVSPSMLLDLTPNPNVEFADADSAPNTPSVVTQPEFLNQCRQELARCVGPMASFLIEDTLDQYPNLTPQGFVEVLASHISSASQASDFVNRISLPISSAGTASGAKPTSGVKTIHQSHGNSGAADLSAVDDAFLERCRQELARCVGPMASFLIEETLADHPQVDPQSFVTLLAAEIPDVSKAEAFQQSLIQR